jgi:hypothetical protein
MSDVTVITNNHRRDVIEAHELDRAERENFDYIDWNKVDAGEASASFMRYKGELHDLGEFEVFSPGINPAWNGQRWDGICTDSFFSGILVRYCEDENFERVIAARYYC